MPPKIITPNERDLGNLLTKHIRPSNKAGDNETDLVRKKREIVIQVMLMSRDLLDIKIPQDHEAFVTEGLDAFLQEYKPDEADTPEKEEVKRLALKEEIRKLALGIRGRIFQTYLDKSKANSTTDSM